MDKSSTKIKYFAYVRKSTEGNERQSLSIPAQKDKISERFPDIDIEFVEDKASAFKPFNRPSFASMVERIHKKERTGLIAWHPDRLSRNEKDAGEITYMLRTGVLDDLKLVTYHFENTPEGIWMLQLALSQSQYESAKKGRDVKRGLGQKAKMGMYPGPAPLGYINNKYAETGKKTVEIDPERFDLCRKLVDMMLTGTYSPPKLLEIATKEWGMTGQRYGKKISRSNIYNLFTRPFYYGEFEYPTGSGIFHKGTHKPLMTRDEYDRIQELLGRKDRPRKKKHDFPYRGPINCGECGALITAETKIKRQKNGNVHEYVYYHCTKRKDPNCSQKSIEEKELEKQIVKALETIEIPKDFKDWGIARLKEMNDIEVNDRNTILQTKRNAYDHSVKKLDVLVEMRLNGEIDEDVFARKKDSLLKEKSDHQGVIVDTDKRIDNWIEVAEKGFIFAETAREAFINGDMQVKKEIVTALGSNLSLKDGKLSIAWDNLLLPIQNIAKDLEGSASMLEPLKNVGNKRRNSEKYTASSSMLGEGCSNLCGYI